MAKRVFLIVLDSVGAGEAPDAAAFGDQGCDTLGTCMRSGRSCDGESGAPASSGNLVSAPGRETDRMLWENAGEVRGKRYNGRALGNRRPYIGKAPSDVSGRIPGGDHP